MKLFRLTISLFLITLSSMAIGQKKFKDILRSTSIAEIQEYLQTAHPEDPKRGILKKKLIELKNLEWTKGAKDAKPMAARPIFVELPNKTTTEEEVEEFKTLMMQDGQNRKNKTAKMLTTLFDQEINNDEAILICKNKSSCNIILRIEGKSSYNLAVPANEENFIVIKKGKYTFKSLLCNTPYESTKEVSKGLLLTLQSPHPQNPTMSMN